MTVIQVIINSNNSTTSPSKMEKDLHVHVALLLTLKMSVIFKSDLYSDKKINLSVKTLEPSYSCQDHTYLVRISIVEAFSLHSLL